MFMVIVVVEIDEDLLVFSVSVDVLGLMDVIGVYVYDGGIGMNGLVVFLLIDVGNGIYVFVEINILFSNLDVLISGEWYLNVYIIVNFNGEVCG